MGCVRVVLYEVAVDIPVVLSCDDTGYEAVDPNVQLLVILVGNDCPGPVAGMVQVPPYAAIHPVGTSMEERELLEPIV